MKDNMIAPKRITLDAPESVPLKGLARRIAIAVLKTKGQYGCWVDGEPVLFTLPNVRVSLSLRSGF